jgi:pimeloyl-ACP methyl ester carboxylesterase
VGTRLRRAVRPLLGLVLLALVVGGGYVGWVGLQRGRPLTLPAPDGPYRVGRTTYDWTDGSRTDPLAPRPGTRRELAVWVWFPAPQFAINSPAPYAPGGWSGLHLSGLPGFFEGDFAAVRTHTLEDATVADGRFPVVVLLPGMGFSAPQYTVLAEGLASHGYLVAGLTPTYSANLTVLGSRAVHDTEAGNPSDLGNHTSRADAEAGRLVDTWAADARFVASAVEGLGRTGQFAGRIQTGRTTYVGHSFGGAASLQACSTDPGCVGAVDLDGTPYGSVVKSGVRAAALLLGSDGSCVPGGCRPDGAADRADLATTRSLVAASRAPVRCYAVTGTGHLSFSDYAAYYLARPLHRLLRLGDLNGRRALAAQRAYVTEFVDHATRGSPQPLLDGRSRPYPEVRAVPGCGGPSS